MFAVVYSKSYVDLLWKMCKGEGKEKRRDMDRRVVCNGRYLSGTALA
jgi:hypothetical protein